MLENIYGVLVSDKRHTVMYMHFYNHLEQEVSDRIRLKSQIGSGALNVAHDQEKQLDEIVPRILGTDYHNLLKLHQAIEYDPVHANCQK